MSAIQAVASAFDVLKQSAGSAVEQLLEATQIEHLWKVVQSRISAHFIDHYQERVKEKCESRPSSPVALDTTLASRSDTPSQNPYPQQANEAHQSSS